MRARWAGERRGERRAISLLLTCLVACQSGSAANPSPPRGDDPVQKVEPFRIFDNLYYIGLDWVSCYLVTTSEGLIVLDSLYGDFVEHAIDGIGRLGFDAHDVRYVLVTHGHYDHAGGAAVFQRRFGARVGMTARDWELVETPPSDPSRSIETAKRDLVLTDGDTVELGDTKVRLLVTPGHTPGVLSMDFEVRDGDRRHRAFLFGGVGLNFSGVARTETYIDSVRRIQRLAAQQPIEVNVTNHPAMGRIFELRDRLVARRPGAPHPFVAAGDYVAWLGERLENAERKLEEERAAAAAETAS